MKPRKTKWALGFVVWGRMGIINDSHSNFTSVNDIGIVEILILVLISNSFSNHHHNTNNHLTP